MVNRNCHGSFKARRPLFFSIFFHICFWFHSQLCWGCQKGFITLGPGLYYKTSWPWFEVKSKWVLPGIATLTQCRPTQGIARKKAKNNGNHMISRRSKQFPLPQRDDCKTRKDKDNTQKPHKQWQQQPSKHREDDHHRPTSETPFEWH